MLGVVLVALLAQDPAPPPAAGAAAAPAAVPGKKPRKKTPEEIAEERARAVAAAQKLFDEGIAHLTAGRIEVAVARLREARRLAPTDPLISGALQRLAPWAAREPERDLVAGALASVAASAAVSTPGGNPRR